MAGGNSKIVDTVRDLISVERPGPEPARFFRELTILVAVFLAARCAVIAAILARGSLLVRSDGANYIHVAESLLETGLLPLDQRQFPGFAILIALVSRLTFTDPVVAGVMLVLVPGAGAVGLFYALTRNFRLSLLLVFFLPGWASSGIMAEGMAMFSLLCAICAFGRDVSPVKGAVLALAGGLLVIVKPPLVFAVLPLGAVAAWSALMEGRRNLLLRGMLFWLPFLLYAWWAMATVGTVRPESAEQLRYTIEQSRGYFPESLMTWPGHSLILGLSDPGERPLKQLSVLATLFLTALGAIGLMAHRHETTPIGGTGGVLAAGVILYTVFHLSVGGPWGFNTQERYLAQISPLILLGIFQDRSPRWWFLASAMAGSLAYTVLAGRQL